VPVFSDKHLSYSWPDAKWMYDTARRLKIPFMAGSSIPLTWRTPPLELPLECDLEGALSVGYGDLEAYGFHTLEVLQCMIERRKGGERGVTAVQLLSGDEVWKAGDAGRWSWELLEAALATDPERKRGDVKTLARAPVAFMLEHKDGFRSAALMLNGVTDEWLFAGKLKSGTVA